jgi:hypothetical protein
LRRRRCQEKGLETKGKSRRTEVGAKNERVEWELEGKLPLFSTFVFFTMVFFSLCFFSFLLLEKKKIPRESA